MKALRYLFLSCLSLLLAGCSDTPEDVSTTSASSGDVQQIVFADYSGLAFQPIIPDVDDPLLPERSMSYHAVQQLVSDAFSDKVERDFDDSKPALVIRYGLASDQIADDTVLAAFFGITPGLTTGDGEHKMTLAISFVQPVTGAVLWRGAVQGILLTDLDRDEQQLRLEAAIRQLLGSFLG